MMVAQVCSMGFIWNKSFQSLFDDIFLNNCEVKLFDVALDIEIVTLDTVCLNYLQESRQHLNN